jgi:hypothetical protein
MLEIWRRTRNRLRSKRSRDRAGLIVRPEIANVCFSCNKAASFEMPRYLRKSCEKSSSLRRWRNPSRERSNVAQIISRLQRNDTSHSAVALSSDTIVIVRKKSHGTSAHQRRKRDDRAVTSPPSASSSSFVHSDAFFACHRKHLFTQLRAL